MPKYLSSTKVVERSQASSSAARQAKSDQILKEKAAQMFELDAIDSFEMLKTKMQKLRIPDGYVYVLKENLCAFYLIQNNVTEAPELLVSVIISDQLKPTAFISSAPLGQSLYKHFLTDGFVKSLNGISNILALCKNIALKEASCRTSLIEVAVSVLSDYVDLTSLLENCSDCENSNLELIKFIIEQLKLLQQPKHGRRYSVNLLTLSFLWQLSSTSLYKKLRTVLILPSISRLRQYSSGLSVETGTLDLSYLASRTQSLNEKERMVTLMIDEVYTAQRIEYSNGCFVGLTEDGKPAKTVLTFMVQSVCSRYKDVVCLIPVSQLDTALLQKWFEKVMIALDKLLFVVAVSVDNHICNR